MSDPSQVITRFAPSPTGALHVGGARTALYNWAYARRHGGRFALRIEDTDQKRSTAESTRGILRDLAWLGIDWDEGPDASAEDPYATPKGGNGPYFQSQRLEIYNEHFQKLIDAGVAYEDDGALRFKMPGTDFTVHDEVLGDVTKTAAELEDFVIRKADGFPTYHFAVVVDDATMGVTHVIRGQEHLNNTHKHIALQDALGLQRPKYAHIPLIFNPDGSKMSKRDKAKVARASAKDWLTEGNDVGTLIATAKADAELLKKWLDKQSDDLATSTLVAGALGVELPEIDVEDFRRSGYLPEVLCNYLALLGWNPGGDIERFDNTLLARQFDFDRVGKAQAKFDRVKLASFNADTFQEMPVEQLGARWRAWCDEFETAFAEKLSADDFVGLAGVYRQRAKTFREACDAARFFVVDTDAIQYDAKAVKKVLEKNGGAGFNVLRDIRDAFAALDPFGGAAAHEAIKAYAESTELGMGKVAQPVRVAVSGGTVSPPIDQTLDILGRDATLARIDRCLQLEQLAS